MKRFARFLLLVLSPLAAAAQVQQMRHAQVTDFQSAWGEIQVSGEASRSPLPKLSRSVTVDDRGNGGQVTLTGQGGKPGEGMDWGTLPQNEGSSNIITAQGSAWCFLKDNGEWKLHRSLLSGSRSQWIPQPGSVKGDVIGFKLTHDGSFSVLKVNAGGGLSQMDGNPTGGGASIDWETPKPLAGNRAAAEAAWRNEHAGSPHLIGEFDIGEEGEFLSFSGVVNQVPGAEIRYRVSPGSGEPYGAWSEPFSPNIRQVKTRGRFLQYQITYKNPPSGFSIPDISISYTRRNPEPNRPDSSATGKNGLAAGARANGGLAGGLLFNSAGPVNDRADLDSDEPDVKDNGSQLDRGMSNPSNVDPDNENQDNQNPHTASTDNQQPDPDTTKANQDEQDTPQDNQQQPDQPSSPEQEPENQPSSAVDPSLSSHSPEANDADNPASTPPETTPQNNSASQQPDNNPQTPGEENSPNSPNPSSPPPETSVKSLHAALANPPSSNAPSTGQPSANAPGLKTEAPQSSGSQPDASEKSPAEAGQGGANQNQPDGSPDSPDESESQQGEKPQSPNGQPSNGQPSANQPSSGQSSTPQQQSSSSTLIPKTPGESMNQAQRDESGVQNSSGGSGQPSSGQNGDHISERGEHASPPSEAGKHGSGNGTPLPNQPQAAGSVGNVTSLIGDGDAETDGSSVAGAIRFPTQSVIGGNVMFSGNNPPEKRSLWWLWLLLAALLLLLFYMKKRKENVYLNPADHAIPPEALTALRSRSTLFTQCPQDDGAFWNPVLLMDDDITAAQMNDVYVYALSDEGCIYRAPLHGGSSQPDFIGKLDSDYYSVQFALDGDDIWIAGINHKGKLGIARVRKNAEPASIALKPSHLPKSLHAIESIFIENKRLWITGETFEEKVIFNKMLLDDSDNWNALQPDGFAKGSFTACSCGQETLFAGVPADQAGVQWIYSKCKRGSDRSEWQLISKIPGLSKNIALSGDDKRCYAAEFCGDGKGLTFHVFPRNEQGRLTDHFASKVNLPVDTQEIYGEFRNGSLNLRGSVNDAPGGKLFLSSAPLRKFIGAPTAAARAER